MGAFSVGEYMLDRVEEVRLRKERSREGDWPTPLPLLLSVCGVFGELLGSGVGGSEVSDGVGGTSKGLLGRGFSGGD